MQKVNRTLKRACSACLKNEPSISIQNCGKVIAYKMADRGYTKIDECECLKKKIKPRHACNTLKKKL